MCLILMQSLQHVHVHAHGTSVSILVGEHFCFLSLQLLSTGFYGECHVYFQWTVGVVSTLVLVTIARF